MQKDEKNRLYDSLKSISEKIDLNNKEITNIKIHMEALSGHVKAQNGRVSKTESAIVDLNKLVSSEGALGKKVEENSTYIKVAMGGLAVVSLLGSAKAIGLW